MDSDEENEEIVLQSDAIAYFDHAPDSSLFAIAQHPTHPRLIAVGGSAGSSDEAPGAGWLFQVPERPVLPESYASGGRSSSEKKKQMESLFHLDGHEDSISALAWTLSGDVLLSAGLDGRLRAWRTSVGDGDGDVKISFLTERREVEEINWLIPNPNPSSHHQTTIALGASDGSVWVYEVDADASDEQDRLRILQSYYLHTASSTAGAWSPDGSLLATVSEDGSLYVWDVRADSYAAASTVVSMTGADQRFVVEGGLFSVTFDPNGAFVAVGGAQGIIKIVSLPRSSTSSGTAGSQVLATLQAQTDSIESLSTSRPSPTTTLLASASVDGTIAIFDASRRFAVRTVIPSAHDGLSVVSVDFFPAAHDGESQWLLDSCGLDGVLRRWDLRANPSSDQVAKPLREWRGHRGGDDGAGGILGFVRTPGGRRIVTAGDDGLALVFEA
ncbi:hypothetical protein CP533_3485 [Ophiocordyceps camponoti-saundersi (nom. inval.)]|nr:hypothetical protein CP533_3485 [Ophiocordyceps camponoti-saundersi (nom. inval.)]